ncbi:unnamed protein product [Diabrotica balteata]|uniref:Uncharacterized protein n=1 Tax=Diabrotica balteata TaxID=107213 RepID=A0A9N9T2W9_DIABA|nr:unnamed protein product [Diabrotica balteata]
MNSRAHRLVQLACEQQKTAELLDLKLTTEPSSHTEIQIPSGSEVIATNDQLDISDNSSLSYHPETSEEDSQESDHEEGLQNSFVLSFYQPKKDQCTKCNTYNASLDKSDLENKWQAHKNRENEALQLNLSDKIRAEEDQGKTFRSISLNLQSILTFPFAGNSAIFYKRKLNAFNFTIFEPHSRHTSKKLQQPNPNIEITEQRKADLTLAKTSYLEKKKEMSLHEEKVAFASFDLEKCLPTPFLNNSVSFYKRSLWTYNHTFYTISNKKATPICYMWDESVAERGGKEIASCLWAYLQSLPTCTEVVNFFSDTCPGQNRNIYIAVMFSFFMMRLAQNKDNDFAHNFMTINQKFLEPGHVHIEADTIHALIERGRQT